MHPHISHKVVSIKLLIIVVILTLLVGCGSTNRNNGQAAETNVNHIETPTDTSTASDLANHPSANKGNVVVDADSLHIQSDDRIECPQGDHPKPFFPPNHLVLATSRTMYNSTEVQQIKSYVNALFQSDDSTTTLIDSIATPLPVSLTWASGDMGCAVTLQITNTGDTTIQIPQVDVRLTAAPQQNNYQYRLIDVCSIILSDSCRCSGCGAGGGSCSYYFANIHLGTGQQGSVFNDTPVSDSSCGQMTLAPSSTLYLNLLFSPSLPNHLMYSLTTELTLKTASGQQVLVLPQLGDVVAFADQSQFSCYGLQNQTFVPVDAHQANSDCL